MKIAYNFGKNKWNKDDFFYAYSPAAKAHKKFIQDGDCIRNSYNEDISDYDYISIVTKEKFSSPVTIRTKCSFESFGAPLIVLSDDISKNADGTNIYGLHFESVAYEEGGNVWHIVPWPERKECPRRSSLIGKTRFPIDDNSLIDIEITIQGNQIISTINGNDFIVTHDDIPEKFHVGITACEGINRFYNFSVEKGEN